MLNLLSKLIFQLLVGVLGLWLAVKFVPGVSFNGHFFLIPGSLGEISIILNSKVGVGALLGFLNFFVKPILNKIALPLRIITLNLFSLVLAMVLIWVVDIFSPELVIQGIKPLLWVTLIFWLLGLLFPLKGRGIFSTN